MADYICGSGETYASISAAVTAAVGAGAGNRVIIRDGYTDSTGTELSVTSSNKLILKTETSSAVDIGWNLGSSTDVEVEYYWGYQGYQESWNGWYIFRSSGTLTVDKAELWLEDTGVNGSAVIAMINTGSATVKLLKAYCPNYGGGFRSENSATITAEQCVVHCNSGECVSDYQNAFFYARNSWFFSNATDVLSPNLDDGEVINCATNKADFGGAVTETNCLTNVDPDDAFADADNQDFTPKPFTSPLKGAGSATYQTTVDFNGDSWNTVDIGIIAAEDTYDARVFYDGDGVLNGGTLDFGLNHTSATYTLTVDNNPASVDSIEISSITTSSDTNCSTSVSPSQSLPHVLTPGASMTFDVDVDLSSSTNGAWTSELDILLESGEHYLISLSGTKTTKYVYYVGAGQADGTSLSTVVTNITNNGNANDLYEIYLYDGISDLTTDISWPADRKIWVYGSEHLKAGNDQFDATWTFPQDSNVVINGVWMETSTADKNLVLMTSGSSTTGYQQFIGCRFHSDVDNWTGAPAYINYAGIINCSFTACLFEQTGAQNSTSAAISTSGTGSDTGILNVNNCVFVGEYQNDIHNLGVDLINTRFCVSDCNSYHTSDLGGVGYMASLVAHEVRYIGDPTPATRVKNMYWESSDDVFNAFPDYGGATRDNIYQYLVDWHVYWVGPEGSINNAISDLGSLSSGQPAGDLYFATTPNARGDGGYCDPIGNFFTSTDGDASNPNGWFRGCWSLATTEEYLPVKFPGEGDSIGAAGRAWTDIFNGNYDSEFFRRKKASTYAAQTKDQYRVGGIDPEAIGFAIPVPGRVNNDHLPPNRS